MNKTRIEWTDYTWNPVTGCLNNCSYCYARKIATRFKGTKAWPRGFEPTIHIDRFFEPMSIRKPSRIFVCSMGELFGDWLNPEGEIPVSLYGKLDERHIELAKIGVNPLFATPLREAILTTVRCCPQHTFQFLTKCPWNLAKWNPWPENAWVGVTTTTAKQYLEAQSALDYVKAKVRYISCEPLLEHLPVSPYDFGGFGGSIDWLIIGAQTNPYHPPQIEWVEEIVEAANKAGIPVFLKDNLKPIIPLSFHTGEPLIPSLYKDGKLRQEWPR